MVCNPGDKPIVTYSFNSGSERKYQSSLSPIDVEIINGVDATDTTNNFSSDGYSFTFYSPNNYRNFTYIIRDYRIVDVGYQDLQIIICGESDWTDTLITIDPNTIEINPNIRCPPDTDQCILKVKYNGSTIFRDKGKQPCIYSVQCGRCPDGQCECYSPVYPGYCCIDCGELSGEIKGIRNIVRGIKNG